MPKRATATRIEAGRICVPPRRGAGRSAHTGTVKTSRRHHHSTPWGNHLHRSARTAVIAAPLLLAIALTGCSTTSDTKPASTATTSATAKAAETKTPTVPSATPSARSKRQAHHHHRRVVVPEDDPQPDAKFYTIITTQRRSAKSNGFTDEDTLSAEKWLATFITRKPSTARPRLEGQEELDWLPEGRKYLTEDMQAIAEEQGNEANIVVAGLWNGDGGPDKIPGRTVRDSRPRGRT